MGVQVPAPPRPHLFLKSRWIISPAPPHLFLKRQMYLRLISISGNSGKRLMSPNMSQKLELDPEFQLKNEILVLTPSACPIPEL